MTKIPTALINAACTLSDQMSGYFLWKDLESNYVLGSTKTAQLFGFKKAHELEGINDKIVRCEASEYADLFINQDNKLKSIQSPLLILDVHPYANHEIKTLLINKSLIMDQHVPVGIHCYCTELDNKIMQNIAIQLSKTNKDSIFNHKLNKASHYYLNGEYEGVHLTRKQSECLFYVIRGKSCKEIGQLLGLSPRTVETHIEIIKDKMNCVTKSELVDRSIDLGFIEIVPSGIFSKKLLNLF